jgi:signal transduction histidine kinase
VPDTVQALPKDKIIEQIFYDELVPEWEPYRVLYTNVNIEKQPYVLMIQLNLVESRDLIITIIWLYLIILFSLLLVIFFITRFISNRLWQPFYATLETVKQFNIEQLSISSFTATKILEFQQLNQSIERLMASNLQSYTSQKTFTQNASHELQTPLAIFQSKLDLLLQDTSITQEQASIVQSLYKTLARLSRINKNLLLLAKIENHQFNETTKFSLTQLLYDTLPYFIEQAESKKLIFKTDLNTQVSITANRGLVEIMVNNLLLNAIKHNSSNRQIIIELIEQKLTIKNTGIQEPLSSSILYKRFGKNTTDTNSSGLGLAIVKEICDRYNWDIYYKFEGDLHQFSISF